MMDVSVVPRMLMLLLGTCSSFWALAYAGNLDPAFSKIPFDEWLASGERAPFKWSLRVSEVRLSVHQRLRVVVEAQIDGAELAKRRGKGQFEVYLQISDADHVRYQDHGMIDLEKLDAGLKSSYVNYDQPVFILPGEYRLAVALLNNATREHYARQMKFRIPELKNDPLPDAWAGLPAVEFIPDDQPPDSWFLPSMKGRLHLPLDTPAPVKIDLLVNLPLASSEPGHRGIPRAGMGPLIAALKTFSDVQPRNGNIDTEVLDLARRRVTFRQNGIREINWERLRNALAEANPGMIDVKSLENRHHGAQFFVSEVARKITSTTGPHVLIVLSEPMAFEPGEDLERIRVTLPENCRLFYCRFRAAAVPGREGVPGRPMTARRAWRDYGMRPALELQFDQLAPTLKPLDPRVFDIANASELRKALAVTLDEIGRH